jgi:hypothetical protein
MLGMTACETHMCAKPKDIRLSPCI